MAAGCGDAARVGERSNPTYFALGNCESWGEESEGGVVGGRGGGVSRLRWLLLVKQSLDFREWREWFAPCRRVLALALGHGERGNS